MTRMQKTEEQVRELVERAAEYGLVYNRVLKQVFELRRELAVEEVLALFRDHADERSILIALAKLSSLDELEAAMLARINEAETAQRKLEETEENEKRLETRQRYEGY